MAGILTVCFVSASGQNIFFAELLKALRTAIETLGVATEESVDHFPCPREGMAFVFVPHEYMPLVHPHAHPNREQLRHAVALTTEQPGTQWFDQSAAVAAQAAVAVDINASGVTELRRRGIKADLLQLGYVPEWDLWQGDADAERPIDFTFMGGHSPRRAGALARCAPVLAHRRASIHLFESVVPHLAGSASFLNGERKWRHLTRSKIIANLHRSELPYFEWQRVIGAVSNGCVVVTEHSTDTAPFVPGEHFATTTAASLPWVVGALLEDAELRNRIRDEA